MEQCKTNRKVNLDQSMLRPFLESSVNSSADDDTKKRKLFTRNELEERASVNVDEGVLELETAYEADVDTFDQHDPLPQSKLLSQREIIYKLFQPWALKTYGDQAKTKTITLRKKIRILKALEGKEHSRPDSSKFRFWVKTKGFTTKRPDGFKETPDGLTIKAIPSENPWVVDLFSVSISKDLGRHIYRKVACVEEFFDIIYNVHMELGGRSGMHAGQKRTYRIITETYAFLPREAVTRFLTICPECKKNLRPSTPTVGFKEADLAGNESSSEVENNLNYSSQTESSFETGHLTKRRRHSSADLKSHISFAVGSVASSFTQLDAKATISLCPTNNLTVAEPQIPEATVKSNSVSMPKIRVKSQIQRPRSPSIRDAQVSAASIQPNPRSMSISSEFQSSDMHLLKSRDSLERYYDFIKRFYTGGLMLEQPVLAPPLYGSSLLQTLSYPTTTTTPNTISTATTNSNQPQSKDLSVLAPFPMSSSITLENLKTSPKKSNSARSPILSINTPPLSQFPNLSKVPFSSSSNVQPSSTSTPVSVPPLKQELYSSSKLSELRIPQLSLRESISKDHLSIELPPLDLERLKPITSTYLQLTRSMGLSDEDALRFDNLGNYPRPTPSGTNYAQNFIRSMLSLRNVAQTPSAECVD